MGFRTGAFAKVWEVTPMSDTSTKLRMSISRKNKKTDEYEQDFSGFVLAIGTAAAAVGDFVRWATVLQPFWMGILVSVAVGMALTLPISSAAICAAISLTGLAGGAAFPLLLKII